jgi:hypothetical protein
MDITVIVFFHIFIINSLFIIIDYFVLKKISKTEVSFLFIMIAGLTSLFLGVYLTNLLIEHYFHDQWFGFSNGVVERPIFLTGVLILTICNTIIELPFYILATKNKKIGLSLKSALISNFGTNLPLGLFHLLGNTFYSQPE